MRYELISVLGIESPDGADRKAFVIMRNEHGVYEVWLESHGDTINRMNNGIRSGEYKRGTSIDMSFYSNDQLEKFTYDFTMEQAAKKFMKKHAASWLGGGLPNAGTVGKWKELWDHHTTDLHPDWATTTLGPAPSADNGNSKPARFGDDDRGFASRFARKRQEEAAALLPRPESIPQTDTTADFDPMLRPFRLEHPEGKKGMKFWEIWIAEYHNPDGHGIMKWAVWCRFGSVGDEGQQRNLAYRVTRAGAVDVRNERIMKKRERGYMEVTP